MIIRKRGTRSDKVTRSVSILLSPMASTSRSAPASRCKSEMNSGRDKPAAIILPSIRIPRKTRPLANRFN